MRRVASFSLVRGLELKKVDLVSLFRYVMQTRWLKRKGSIRALVKLHRLYTDNLGMLVARYYILFHPRNFSQQLNLKFLRHRTFDGDVDTIDDLLSDFERALAFVLSLS